MYNAQTALRAVLATSRRYFGLAGRAYPSPAQRVLPWPAQRRLATAGAATTTAISARTGP